METADRKYNSRFRFWDKTSIPDVASHIYNTWEKEKTLTVSIGCDSKQTGKYTTYVVAIVIYNEMLKKGASVVYYEEKIPRIVEDDFSRLYRETDLVIKILEELCPMLEEKGMYREDIKTNPFLLKKYKYHLAQEKGEYDYVPLSNEENVINAIPLSDAEKNIPYKLLDVHVDYAYKKYDTSNVSNRFAKFKLNKSFPLYEICTPMLRGMGYLVYRKPNAYAASSAADFIVNGDNK